MTTDADMLRDIPGDKPVRVFLPIKNSKERYRVQAIFQKTTPPRFNLLFKPGTIPLEDLDTDSTCLINVDLGGPTVSVEARITSASNQVLEMIVQKSISHDQMREFFRVDATTEVISKSFQSDLLPTKGEEWVIRGKTVDISGSGILATFPEKPPMDDQIRLEITLPTEPAEIIKVLAHPIRVIQLSDEQWEVAFHFDDISDEDRDKIIGCCLVIQRQMLRLKVQVRDM